jgi:ssDNA-binding Zn-finger/Zn-ribbon topoisomerase 1
MLSNSDDSGISPQVRSITTFVESAVAQLRSFNTAQVDHDKTSGTQEEQGALLYFGNWQDPIPRLLILDRTLDASDVRLWAYLRTLFTQPGMPSVFPSYREIQQDLPMAKATLAGCISILRATRWITRCATVRDARGRFKGNIYALHNEPLNLADTLYLDDEYMAFLAKSSQHSYKRVRVIASAVLDTIRGRIGEDSDITASPTVLKQAEQRLLQAQSLHRMSTETNRSLLNCNWSAIGKMQTELLNTKNLITERSETAVIDNANPSSDSELGENEENPPSSNSELGENNNLRMSKGWREALGRENGKESSNQPLPPVKTGQAVTLDQTNIEDKETKPPARFSEGTLIQAMKSIGKMVTDPKLKAILKETAGLGTEATRAGIIQTLLKRGFVAKQKKCLISTEVGKALIDAVPEAVKNPATTAIWEQQLDIIAQGEAQLDDFLLQQTKHVRQLVEAVAKQDGIHIVSTADTVKAHHACPDCGKPMHRRKAKTSKSWFWGCSGYPDCKSTLPDNSGRPGKHPKNQAVQTSRSTQTKVAATVGSKCPECETGTLLQRALRTGPNAGNPFIGCTNFPKCKFFSWSEKF